MDPPAPIHALLMFGTRAEELMESNGEVTEQSWTLSGNIHMILNHAISPNHHMYSGFEK